MQLLSAIILIIIDDFIVALLIVGIAMDSIVMLLLHIADCLICAFVTQSVRASYVTRNLEVAFNHHFQLADLHRIDLTHNIFDINSLTNK